MLNLIAGDELMTVQMQQLAVMALPGGRELAVYIDREAPAWTGPACWWWQEDAGLLNVGFRIPLTACGIRVMCERLAAAR